MKKSEIEFICVRVYIYDLICLNSENPKLIELYAHAGLNDDTFII
jgi:hypothetical protein